MNEMRKVLHQAIVSNVPDCVLFSGGIDSSAVLYESKIINDNVKAITVGVTENDSEDIKYSKYVSQKLGVELLVCNVDRKCILSKVDEAVKILKSFNPEWISSTVTLLLGVEYAKCKGFFKVASGEGADDLFGSFPFFKTFNGPNKELEYIMNTRFENIPVMTNLVTNANNVISVLPFRNIKVVDYIKSISLEERMLETDKIKTKYPLRNSYIGILPYEAIVRPQTMAFTGSGIYDIIKKLGDEISDIEYRTACKEIFEFKNKIEYALFKKYIKYYKYIKSDNLGCVHCKSDIKPTQVNCNCCQTVQYKRKVLKFNA